MTTPTEPTVHGVQIDAQPGHVDIRIDAARLPSDQITGYVLEHDVTVALPTLILHTRQPDHVQWQGLARVAVAERADPGPTVAEFLRAVDPAALERAALDRNDLDGSRHELTRAMLAQLTDWALGKGTG
ncbi:hypothetical protein ACFWV1_25910 [Streptomyces sp. NPDC058700]|uniref:hypothetical protein n=1 Tax=Streptomyces sp. NPDC058700 TaxID=3346607 RepID=UPI00365A2F9E